MGYVGDGPKPQLEVGDISTKDVTATGDLTVDTNTLYVDSTNNRVGVGTVSPAVPLHVKVGTDENFFMSSDSGVRIQAINDAASAINTMKIGGDPLIFLGTGGTERMRIDSSGNVDLYQGNNLTWRYAAGSTIRGSMSIDSADNITFSNGSSNTERMRIQSGGGISFNGDTAAANALDDYEEGTFTPTYSFSSGGGSFSYSIQVGYYTKVGRFVFVMIRIRGQKSGTGSGALQIAGLPFTVLNVTNLFGTGAIGFTNNWNNRPMGAYIEANSNKVTLTKGANSSNTYSDLDTTVVNADLDTGSTSSNDLILTISYIT